MVFNKDEEKKQEQVDVEKKQDFSNGPIRNRRITDCIFCILMIAFWVFCVWLAIYSFKNGNIEKIKMVMDDDNVACGSQEYGT